MRLLRLRREENENKSEILLKISGGTTAILQWQSTTTSFNPINSLLWAGGGTQKNPKSYL